MYEFDHLVIAAESLDAGVAWAEERLGVSLEVGGQHLRYGTHNALLGLADGLYLEVIAIDPAGGKPAHARWFGFHLPTPATNPPPETAFAQVRAAEPATRSKEAAEAAAPKAPRGR